MTSKKLLQLFVCISVISAGLKVNAQIALVKNILDKIGNHRNFSYQSVNKEKELFVLDTVIERQNSVFKRDLSNQSFGYQFNIQIVNEKEKATYTKLYDGQDFLLLNPRDSSYDSQDIGAFSSQKTLPGFLRWLNSRLESKLAKIVKVNDTTIRGVASHHLTVNVYDTVVNKERNYTFADLYVDKLSGMPNLSIIRSRNTTYGSVASTYYSEISYFDYRFDQMEGHIASFTRPAGYHLPAEKPILTLLKPGADAPDWSLNDSEGQNVSLGKLKGKVVLIDFFFIGCGPCMLSLKPLENLYKKYKNIEVLSISQRDSNKQVAAFKKAYNIKYAMYGDAENVAEAYHMISAPTFYLIDQEGKISSVFVGNPVDFEKEMSAIIDKLLKQS